MTHRIPDEETLAAYFEGLLDPMEEAAVRRALTQDPATAELVAALGLMIQAEPADAFTTPVPAHVTRAAANLWPAEPVAQRVGHGLRLAARWIGETLQPLADALAPTPQPALALRGAAAEALPPSLTWQLELGPVPVELTVTVEGAGQVALAIRPLGPPPAGALLRISAADQLRAMSSLGPDGATVSALPAATYTLALEAPEGELGRVDLDLSEQA